MKPLLAAAILAAALAAPAHADDGDPVIGTGGNTSGTHNGDTCVVRPAQKYTPGTMAAPIVGANSADMGVNENCSR